ncbi:Hypothetical SAV0801 homolog in superantigen-encoding pathogenicity islands SaPI [Weissella confusa]|uniref:Abi family protein n=1 Tax=Weissella confusa TaxID=1583 RepID=UPI000989A3A4|nr:Abi family protein [Weissella confusa]SJX70217.1 Hypothetical SAV0801 homolog in superantigen-encoding pathogenicity islands SaPI [Weissella confusa]
MDNEKIWLSIDDQIRLLKSRGMLISDDEYSATATALMKYGYYEIINGYREPYLVNGQHDEFVPGTRFHDLFKLFEFDQNLRDATQSAIEMFELVLRQSIARVFSENHTERQEAYLSFKNYRSPRKPTRKLAGLISRLANVAYSDLREPFAHYRNKYGNVPPWIVVKALDFGGIKIWYSFLNSDDKHQVVEELLNPRFVDDVGIDRATKIFGAMLDLMHQFRNKAAHGGRIYNYFPESNAVDKKGNKLPLIPYFSEVHPNMRITPYLYREGFGNSGVWLLMKLFFLLDSYDISELFSERFEDAISDYISTNVDSLDNLKSEMKIPNNDAQIKRAFITVYLSTFPDSSRETLKELLYIKSHETQLLNFLSNRLAYRNIDPKIDTAYKLNPFNWQ